MKNRKWVVVGAASTLGLGLTGFGAISAANAFGAQNSSDDAGVAAITESPNGDRIPSAATSTTIAPTDVATPAATPSAQTANTPNTPNSPQTAASPVSPASPQTPASPVSPQSPQSPQSPVSPISPASPVSAD
ncbi:hypothetical protein [Homoserinibacter sp. YIM 151385]|uniref:hypothetical protein n=1 Tax=Homoserinibacter sp. YIM 151385 TaxID=2985506 RepID=UPI0022F0FE5D|nr:hypothetical protein [Homoserinibacter sp. YIM 151385]WBU38996.1 hypothetical protein OF852_05295 [Homoserinibacter sp. YIM 151385]